MAIDEKDLPRGPVGFRFTTRVTLGDYTGDLELTAATLNDLRKAVKLLPEASIAAVPVPTEWQRTPEGLPICRKHAVAMKAREKQGDMWHSHNVGTEKDPLWCRGYAGKDSPGWEYEPPQAPAAGPPAANRYGRH